MFYVRSQMGNGLFNIVDTDDGSAENFPKNILLDLSKLGLAIKGVSENNVSPIDYMSDVLQKNEVNIKNMVLSLVQNIDIETIYGLASGNGFAKEIKSIEKAGGLHVEENIRRCTAEHIYDGTVSSVIDSIKDSASVIRDVNALDRQAVLSALQGNVCLIVQYSTTNNKITSFIGTTNLGIVDELYGKYAIDYITLHNEYLGYIERMSAFRETKSYNPNPNIQKVYSCSLRARETGKRVVKYEMSSTEYSVNLATTLACFVLSIDNVWKFKSAFSNTVTSLQQAKEAFDASVDATSPVQIRNMNNDLISVNKIMFNQQILDLVKSSVNAGELSIHDENELKIFMRSNNLSDCIYEPNLTTAVDKMKKAFMRVKNERQNGGKYIVA